MGWLNYFSISEVTHIWETIKVIIPRLDYKLFKWLKGKGRKARESLRQRPYRNLVAYKNLLRALEDTRESSMKNSIGKPRRPRRVRKNFMRGLTRAAME